MGQLQTIESDKYAVGYTDALQEFVTMRIGDELFGVSVMAVQDVLRRQVVAHVPLSPSIVAGSLNLRGRIVTVLDMRNILGLPPVESVEEAMHVVVEYNGELYSLMVDRVGEVLGLPLDKLEKSPANLSEAWREIAAGVFKLEEDILVILDAHNLLNKRA